MTTTELHLVIMHREDISLKEADRIVQDMKERVRNGENPEEVLFDEGLEPDYIFDLL